MASIGQRIRELRMKKGLTQAELAKGICTPSMCSQVEGERARPSYKMLTQFAERLDVSLDHLLQDMDVHEKMMSSIKMARAMVRAKDYQNAIPLLEDLLDAPPNAFSKRELQFSLAECYLKTGQHDAAEQQLKDVRHRARLQQDHDVLAEVGYLFGCIEWERKRFQVAIHHWMRALDELGKSGEPDVFLKQNLLSKLGEAHNKLGLCREATAFYLKAAAVLEGLGNLHEIAAIYKKLAESFLRMNDWYKVAEYAQRAETIFETLEHIRTKWKLQMNTAIAYAHTDREAEAVALLEEVVEKFQEHGLQEDAGIALAELASVHLENGNPERAEEAAEEARRLLPELHVYQAYVHRVLGRVASERGEREAAIRSYQKAADCFKLMNEVGEWEQTMFDLSRLYQAEQNSEQVIHILESMRRFTKHVLDERGIVL